MLEPASTVSGIVSYALSGMRVINRAAEPSPLLRRRSLATRTEAIEIPLSDLHKAAKAGGGSINDAYLAGLCGGLRRYHDALGVPVSTLPMAVPVSLRADADTVSADTDTSSYAADVSSHLDGVRTRCAGTQQGQCEECDDKYFRPPQWHHPPPYQWPKPSPAHSK